MNLDLWVTFLQDQDIAKNLKNNQFAKTLKMDLIFMNMSIYQKSTLGGPVKKQFVLQSCFFNLLPRHTNFF